MAVELIPLIPNLDVDLRPSTGGVFEVQYQGKLLFSKSALGRFPEPGEIPGLLGLSTTGG